MVPFFESLGFRLPPRKGTADFLQEITSKKDQRVCSNILHATVMPFLIWAPPAPPSDHTQPCGSEAQQ